MTATTRAFSSACSISSVGNVTHVLPWGKPLTYDDLQTMADDGHRYELVDGTLIVTPSPRRIHQRAVTRLVVLLASAAAPEIEVLTGPFDYVVSDVTVLEPDILVAYAADYGEKEIRRTPLLVIEVLSPSTRRFDLGTKRLAFEGAGVPSYWLIDPDQPSLTVLELEDGVYRETAFLIGDDSWAATRPFPVTVVPSALVR
jgi:Uma2 family endonuclease